MSAKGSTYLIVNSPCELRKHRWHHYRETRKLSLNAGRVVVDIVDDWGIESLKILEIGSHA